MNILQLLNEAADLSTPEKIYKAFEKGMIPGIKKKAFFNKEAQEKYSQKHFENSLGNMADMVRDAGFTGARFNPAFFLTLKKIGTYQNLRVVPKKILDTNWFDALHAYFNNKNKQEVKNDPKVAKKFKEFEERKFNDNNIAEDKGFENWVNEKFAGKAKMKDERKEAEKIYNKDGWEIIIPKTFAAAKKYACMADRKARWCTSASPDMFKSYTEGNNKLYIIRNVAKNLMYQMDWDVAEGKYFRYPNFKDEKDLSIKVGEVVKNIPDDVLAFLKDPLSGKSIKELYDKRKEKEKEPEKEEAKPLEGEKGWTIRKLTPSEAAKELKGVKFSFGPKSADDLSLEELMSGQEKGGDNRINYVEEITNGKKYYYYVDGTVRKSKYSFGGASLYNNIFEKKGDKLIAKTAQGLARLKNFPESVKKKLFKPSNLPIGEKKKKGEEIAPDKEIGGAKFYKFKSINQVFDVAGKPKLGKAMKMKASYTDNESEPLAFFKKGDTPYFLSISNGNIDLKRFGFDDRYGMSKRGENFQYINYMKFAFLNKTLAKHLIEVALRSPKLKRKELWKEVPKLIDKEKIEATENGKRFILQKNPKTYGKALEIVSPDFPKEQGYILRPPHRGNGIEVMQRNPNSKKPGINKIGEFTSPEVQKLEKIERVLPY